MANKQTKTEDTATKDTTPEYDEMADLMKEAEQMVAAQMAPPEAPARTQQDVLNERMVTALEALSRKNDTGPTPQIPFSKVKIRTPWNPTGTKKRPKLARPTYINSRKIGELWHTAEEIEKLNQLKPGHYYGRKITVWHTQTSEGVATINLQFPNKTAEQRLAIAQLTKGRGLVGILDLVLEEQSAVAVG